MVAVAAELELRNVTFYLRTGGKNVEVGSNQPRVCRTGNVAYSATYPVKRQRVSGFKHGSRIREVVTTSAGTHQCDVNPRPTFAAQQRLEADPTHLGCKVYVGPECHRNNNY